MNSAPTLSREFVPISKLQFGFPDARQYQSPLEIKRFKEIYFPDTTHIQRLKSEPIYFVVGDKGTGKTALSTWFVNGLDGETTGLSLFLQKDDFSRFYDFSRKIPEFDRADYGEMWKALILLLLSFWRVSDAKAQNEVLSEKAKAFAEALDGMSFGAFDFSAFSAFKVIVSQAQVASRTFLKNSFSDSGLLSFYLRAMQNYFLEILKDLPVPQKKVFVFVDGLDVRPSAGVGSHLDHMANVTHLINSMWTLNYRDFPSHLQNAYRVVVLVRPDIFENVELQNISNIWRSNTIQIAYPVRFNTYRSSSLFKLADALLHCQQPACPLLNYRSGECWDTYLPDMDEATASMRDPNRDADDSFVSIIKNTFSRPRDIIYYLDYWRLVAITNKDGDAPYFDPRYTGRPQFRSAFNDYLLGEIRDSLSFYTEVSDYIIFIQFFHHLQPFFPVRERQSLRDPNRKIRKSLPHFDHNAFGKAYENFIRYLDQNRIQAPEMFARQERFLRLLYELNVVSFETQGADRPIWKSYGNSKAEGDFRPQVRLDGSYRLHWGLARAIYKDFL